jgi:hypothetical protein
MEMAFGIGTIILKTNTTFSQGIHLESRRQGQEGYALKVRMIRASRRGILW